MLSEDRQRKTNTVQFHLHVESNKTNKQNRNRPRDIENKLMVAKGERDDRWVKRKHNGKRKKNTVTLQLHYISQEIYPPFKKKACEGCKLLSFSSGLY